MISALIGVPITKEIQILRKHEGVNWPSVDDLRRGDRRHFWRRNYERASSQYGGSAPP